MAGGGSFSQRTRALWVSPAEITIGASMTSPEASSTPWTAGPSHRMWRTRAPTRTVPPASSNAACTASGSAPLPPTGRPVGATCFVAYVSAPSPVPGVSGATPHTVGPRVSAGVSTWSVVKNERSTSAALRLDHRSSVGMARDERIGFRPRLPSTEPGVGVDWPISLTIFATGKAAFRYRR